MKCKTVLDIECVIDERCPQSYLGKYTFKAIKGNREPVTIWPEGTEFGDEDPPVLVPGHNGMSHALFMCVVGQAHPSDAECLAATGKTEEELRAIQASYFLTANGYHRPADHKLAMEGVILGVDPKTGEPIPGPHWEAYQKAKAELEKDDEL